MTNDEGTYNSSETVGPINTEAPLIAEHIRSEHMRSDQIFGARAESEAHFTSDAQSNGIVVARGTGDGLILRLDGRVDRQILLSTLLDYVDSRKSFFSGQEATLEWIEARPEEGVVSELSQALSQRFQLIVKASRMFERAAPRNTRSSNSTGILSSGRTQIEESPGAGKTFNNLKMRPASTFQKVPVLPKMNERPSSLQAPQAISSHQNLTTSQGGSGIHSSTVNSYEPSLGSGQPHAAGSSLFDGVAALSGGSNLMVSGTSGFGNVSSSFTGNTSGSDGKGSASESLLWDEADARIIRETLRGGQKIDSEHSVIIVGDVNSGAEIVAGGDIFVLGRLRGVAHAGAYDESGGGRRIFALQMQPTQLRIGSTISQGSEEGGRVPEMAKIEGNMIVVEPYGIVSSTRKTSR